MTAAPKTIVVDVISDVACPWCWVGKRTIEVAEANLHARNLAFSLELRFHPFQLAPHMPQGTTKSYIEHVGSFMGGTAAVQRWVSNPELIPMNRHCQAARLPNIRFVIHPDQVVFNTYKAHTLLTYAGPIQGDYKAQGALKEAMLRATHGEGRNLDDVRELTAVAKEVGLAQSEAAVMQILHDPAVRSTLEQDLRRYTTIRGFSGVPNFTFPNGARVSGAGSVEEFEQILTACLGRA